MSDPISAPPIGRAQPPAAPASLNEDPYIEAENWEFSVADGWRKLSPNELGIERAEDFDTSQYFIANRIFDHDTLDDDPTVTVDVSKYETGMSAKWRFSISLHLVGIVFSIMCPALPDCLAAVAQLEPLCRVIDRPPPKLKTRRPA